MNPANKRQSAFHDNADNHDSAEIHAEERFFAMRKRTRDIVDPLTPEDMQVQAMVDASPTKWHLAHTTWFFETFVLSPHVNGYRGFDDTFAFCYNSYYEAIGPRHARPERGLLTRPTAEEIFAYRTYVDEALRELFASGDAARPEIAALLELGRAHEQQHQELMLTDVLALFAASPLRPRYRAGRDHGPHGKPSRLEWVKFAGGLREIGYAGEGFHFDNEGPRHEALVHPFALADRLVANSEWLEFMSDGGYDNPALWLSDGWAHARREGWEAPLYFEQRDGAWMQMTLDGLSALDPAAPVCHVSYYEADAFARWAGKRLPSEFEWELAAQAFPVVGNMLDSAALRPMPAGPGEGLKQIYGDVWQWTQGPYAPYPRYRAPAGAIGEYNGKFMFNQMVLRGASCVTANDHSRASYRNFFYPWQRWQFSGLRLADDV